MNSYYNPREYFFEDMIDSFQADLVDQEEQLNAEAFTRACKKSEKNSLYFEMGNIAEIEKFIKTANTFDARLIGVMNEWAEAEDKTYARDGILIDGKTASQVMWERGCSFVDVIGLAQKALDHQGQAPFDKLQISIGGPAFLTSENILLTVKEKGQINKGNRERSALGEIRPVTPEDVIHTNSQINREFLIAEQELEKRMDETGNKAPQDLENLEELIEREEQALELFGEKADKGMKPGEYTATFYMLGRDGQVHEKITSNSILEEHKVRYDSLSKKDESKEQTIRNEKREKISMEELEEPLAKRHFDRQTPKMIQKEPILKRERFQK